MQAMVPVLASCALSDDDLLRDRAARMAEHWVVRLWYQGPGINLFLDTLIASPVHTDRKVRVLVRLMQALEPPSAPPERHHIMSEISRVLLGYPEAVFPVVWEAATQTEGYVESVYGVKYALLHLTGPISDALIDAARSGDRSVVVLLLKIFARRGGGQPIYREVGVSLPTRLHPTLIELMTHDDRKIAQLAQSVYTSYRVPGVAALLRSELDSGPPQKRARAIADLTSAAGREAIPDLMARIDDPEAPVRAAVLNALGRLDGVDAKDVILQKLETDEDESVREAAVRAYGKVATDPERAACLERIRESGDRSLIRTAGRALYSGGGPRQPSQLEKQRLLRIRGDRSPGERVNPIDAIRALPEIGPYGEEELTRIVAGVCSDYSTTRRQMVMEGRHALMRRKKGVYTFTPIGDAGWRVGRFIDEAEQRLARFQSSSS